MPECPKCGKILSNDNTLLYHLNKKFPCDSYKCASCKKIFATKFHLQVHEMKCEVAQALNKKKLSLNPFEDRQKTNKLDPSLLQYIYQSCPDVIIETDTKLKINSVSPSVLQVMGYTQDEMIGENLMDYIHEEDQEKMIEHCIDNGKISLGECGQLNKVVSTSSNDENHIFYLDLRKRNKRGEYISISSVYWNSVDSGFIVIDRPITSEIK